MSGFYTERFGHMFLSDTYLVVFTPVASSLLFPFGNQPSSDIAEFITLLFWPLSLSGLMLMHRMWLLWLHRKLSGSCGLRRTSLLAWVRV